MWKNIFEISAYFSYAFHFFLFLNNLSFFLPLHIFLYRYFLYNYHPPQLILCGMRETLICVMFKWTTALIFLIRPALHFHSFSLCQVLAALTHSQAAGQVCHLEMQNTQEVEFSVLFCSVFFWGFHEAEATHISSDYPTSVSSNPFKASRCVNSLSCRITPNALINLKPRDIQFIQLFTLTFHVKSTYFWHILKFSASFHQC